MADNSANNKKIVKNTIFLYVRMIFVLVVSLYTTRVVLKALGIVDYGIYNVVGGFVSMFAFLNTSMSNGIQRFYNFRYGKEGEEGLMPVYNNAFRIQLLIAIIILVLLETLGMWYLNYKMVIPEERLGAARWIFQLSSFSLLLVVMQIPYSASIMAHEKMDYFALISILDAVLKLGVAFVIPAMSADKLVFYGFFLTAISLINFMLYFIYAKNHFASVKLVKGYDKSLFKEMLSFSGWNVFGTFAFMVQTQGLNVLLNAFFGPVVNAARGIANQISGAIQGFSSNIVVSFRPQLVQSYATGDNERVRNLMFSLSKISYIMLFMLSLPIALEIKYILNLWLDDVVPDYTVVFTILVLVNMLLSCLNTPITQVVHATGKMKLYQICFSSIVFLSLPVSWVFLKFGFSPVSVFWVTIAITVVNQVVCLYILRHLFPFSLRAYASQVILPCFLLTIITPILPGLLSCIIPESFYRLILVCLVSCTSVVIVGYYIILSKSEKEMVKPYLNKFFKIFQK